MSLRGVISTIGADQQSSFDEATKKLKQAFQDVTGVNLHNQTDSGSNISIEGIVQGEIKLQAVNDWKTTLFYGFSDSMSNVGFSGTNASAIIKFANTVGNVLGYTLGGTGPASKKMYGGSNLNGFNIQFKWYTPYMAGWKEAIQALTFIAWPSSPFGGDEAEKLLSQRENQGIDEATREKQYLDIIERLRVHTRAVLRYIAILDRAKSGAIQPIDIPSGMEGFSDIAQSHTDNILNFPSSYDTWVSELRNSIAKDFYVNGLCVSRSRIKINPQDVGNPINTVPWNESPNTLEDNPTAIELDSGGNPPVAVKEDVTKTDGTFESTFKGGKLLSAASNILAGTFDLVEGLANSIAVNPPKVMLEIYSGNDSTVPKYRFSPLVITSFAVTSSRETINGDPVIVTIDISFDYYTINSTGSQAADKANQRFAGVPIFKAGA